MKNREISSYLNQLYIFNIKTEVPKLGVDKKSSLIINVQKLSQTTQCMLDNWLKLNMTFKAIIY